MKDVGPPLIGPGLSRGCRQRISKMTAAVSDTSRCFDVLRWFIAGPDWNWSQAESVWQHVNRKHTVRRQTDFSVQSLLDEHYIYLEHIVTDVDRKRGFSCFFKQSRIKHKGWVALRYPGSNMSLVVMKFSKSPTPMQLVRCCFSTLTLLCLVFSSHARGAWLQTSFVAQVACLDVGLVG